MTTGQGFRPFLLKHLQEIVGYGATPQYKMDPFGFLNLLNSSKKPQVLQLNNAAGHQESVQIKYKQRYTKEFVKSTIDCDKTNVNPYKEVSVALTSTSSINLHIDDETIAKYEDDASKTVNIGQPATAFMNEFLEEIYSAVNALLSKVNSDLLTVQSANMGVNARTGVSTATTLNINKNATVNDLLTDLTLLQTDYAYNSMKGMPNIVGGGLFSNFAFQQYAKSASQTGLDSAIMFNKTKFFYDLDVASTFAANNILVFEPDAVQIVEYMEYTGFKAGPKPGGSVFGVMPLPMTIGDDVVPVKFDFQLKYSDCAQTITDQYYGTPITIQKGYNLIISKKCGLFNVPSDAYRAGDRLVGNRGSLLYNITNTCTDCG